MVVLNCHMHAPVGGRGFESPPRRLLLFLFRFIRISGSQATYLAFSLLLATTSAAAKWIVVVAGHQGSGFDTQ